MFFGIVKHISIDINNVILELLGKYILGIVIDQDIEEKFIK